jgi:ABC-type transport system involved in multi-copper enzyme maturation permease subunit
MIYKIITIAKNTFTETLRQPIYAVIMATALILLLLSPSVAMYTLDEDVMLLREIGLSTLFLTGLFIAIFSATGAVTEEIETKTITTVLSKPISRPAFILGKFIGVAAAVTIAHYICTSAMLMTIRHGVLESVSETHDWTVITAAAVTIIATILLTAFFNFTYDWNFTATAIRLLAIFSTFSLIFLSLIDRNWQFNPQNNDIAIFDISASILLLFAALLLVALAIMFSTRLNVVLTLLSCIAVFMFGLVSDYVFGRFADQHLWAKAGRILMPNLQVFWVTDAIYENATVPLAYLGITSVYTACYIAGILFIATALFQRRQVG